MATIYQSNRRRKIFVIVFFVLLALLKAITSGAQNNHIRDTRIYRGFEGSFGTRTFKFNSNIAELNTAYASQTGGQIGLVAGNEVWRFRLGILGYYSQTSNITGQMDLYENHLTANFYPLSLLNTKKSFVVPYIIAGISSDRTKFHGHYTTKDEGLVNYSSFNQPYIGSINSFCSTIGAGVDIKVIDNFNFVHLFTEATYGVNVYQNTKSDALANTKAGNQMNVNIGIRFGAHNVRPAEKR